MAFDYFTIGHLAREMAAALTAGEITAVDHRHNQGADAGPGHGASLYLSVRPSRRSSRAVQVANHFGPVVEALHLSESPASGARTSVRQTPDRGSDAGADVERYLRGAAIVAVEADRRERQINFRLRRRGPDGSESFGRLVFELVHRRFQTILMAERSELVIGSWPLAEPSGRHRRDQRVRLGEPYAAAPNTRLLPGEDDGADFVSLMRSGDQPRELMRVLMLHLCGADRHVVGELLARAGVEETRRCFDCPDGDLRRIWDEASAVYAAQPSTDGCFSWTESGDARFSSLEPTRHVADLVHLATVSEAVERWMAVSVADTASAPDTDRHRAARSMRTRLRALERKRCALQADLDETEEAADCEKKGAVLLTHAGGIGAGAAEVELEDTYDQGGTAKIVIELDPQRSIADMAGRYLKRAAKLKKRTEVLPARLAQLDGDIEQLTQTIHACEQGRLPQDRIDGWIQERSSVSQRASTGSEPRARPRRYRTTAGWIVWAGRNNRENDVLTHRLAAAEDIWFHAHGYAGSHVVLRRDGRTEQPSSRTLEEAAGVAAYWSKGRTANKVGVVYTAVKHVRKPRGSAPGLAVLSREKTIVVRPELLPQEDEAAGEDLWPWP